MSADAFGVAWGHGKDPAAALVFVNFVYSFLLLPWLPTMASVTQILIDSTSV